MSELASESTVFREFQGLHAGQTFFVEINHSSLRTDITVNNVDWVVVNRTPIKFDSRIPQVIEIVPYGWRTDVNALCELRNIVHIRKIERFIIPDCDVYTAELTVNVIISE